ncbi:MAG TPA: PQQ-dependent sugar dehydrogenase [Casimicrobiaceae bacterium]|nr:PQQ-dependent sugar dehydrogenase [Casimicrobiaceae bacterium]
MQDAAASGHSLHFFGTGSGDVDRVKIRIDDPATSLPGPPADVGATDFSVEFWIMAAAVDNTAPAVICGANANWVNGNVVLDRDRFGQPRSFGVSIAGGKIVFGVSSDIGSLTLCGVSNVLDNTWHHIAVERRRSDGNVWLFVDGALEAQSVGPPGDVSYPDNAVPANMNDPYLVIGAEKFDTAPGHAFHGYFDELRLSTRLRYLSAFPRPKAPFLSDAYTAALYHFDDGDGNPVHDSATAVGGPSDGARRIGGPNNGPKWSTVTPFDFGAVQIAFKQLVTGASPLVDIANAHDGSGKLFLVEQTGMIRIVQNDSLLSTPFLDIHTLVQYGGEQGLLSLAFDPNYKSNGFFYVYYTAPTPGNIGGQEVLARYQRSAADPNVADPLSAIILLTIPHPDQTNHNGGKVAFGPDSYLYLSVGDGGGGYDPFHAGQNLSDRRAKLHRIDVHSGLPYTIPPTNPYAGSTCTTACPEIWAYGLRNPFRISFDRLTGDLFIGDVGQDLWEEIDFQLAGAAGGANYGWSVCEGNHLAGSSTQLCTLTGDVRPIIEYGHDDAGGNVVTGGYRYRGTALPMLAGSYVYADFGSGHVWAAQINEDGTWNTQLVTTQGGISTFGEDEDGELYASDYGSGTLYKLVAPDSDGDGLPDWWEATYFGVAGTTPGADPDGDGLTNLQEYQLGRDPRLFSPLTVAGDLSGDGKAEVVWRHTSGANVVWQFDALGNIVSSGLAGVPTTWYLGAIADINGDSRSDLIWVNPGTGQVLAWLQNGATTTSTVALPGIGAGSGWSLEASGDLDGDGYRDLIWRKTDGTVVGWKMINGAVASTVVYPSAPPSAWDLVGTGDFDLDAKAEILWRHIPDNAYFMWRYADTGNVTSQFVGAPGGTWTVQLIADFDGDGKADLFWRDGSGANAIWLGGDPSNAVFPPGVGIDWTPIAAGNYGGSTRAGILWMRNDGIVAQWLFSDAAGLSAPSVRFLTGIPPGWQAINP